MHFQQWHVFTNMLVTLIGIIVYMILQGCLNTLQKAVQLAFTG